ncbi:hypothetical protein HOT31_gp098 [Microbacterium phage Hendrix]|uniref:Uncharacterized protein n=1 Tax=Microbacterium phage Hendrix TaxID=2182341 RepID=A0A2U8UUG9_9CAUD|nr:hypothetical protein HOT31_gp098 [Microbacterium phage Hendrix]AWN07769.1 hypothetical protein PBI_HENDRIX_98 [Microbacterium phage Hendrix]
MNEQEQPEDVIEVPEARFVRYAVRDGKLVHPESGEPIDFEAEQARIAAQFEEQQMLAARQAQRSPSIRSIVDKTMNEFIPELRQEPQTVRVSLSKHQIGSMLSLASKLSFERSDREWQQATGKDDHPLRIPYMPEGLYEDLVDFLSSLVGQSPQGPQAYGLSRRLQDNFQAQKTARQILEGEQS